MGRVAAVLLSFFILAGCSTASWIVDPPPRITDLYVTEDDVIEYFERLSGTEPSDPDAVLYNPETDRYEVRAIEYQRGLTKTIMYEIQRERISEFAEDYSRETFGTAIKRDLGTAGICGVIIAVAIAVLLGL